MLKTVRFKAIQLITAALVIWALYGALATPVILAAECQTTGATGC